MEEPLDDLLMANRLRWLGHLGGMAKERLPKRILFGELEKRRPCHGTKKRWRDGVKSDLQATGIGDWYGLAQDRSLWRAAFNEGIKNQRRKANDCAANRVVTFSDFLCPCGRSFRRKGGLTRHSHFCTVTTEAH
jgi:hypothetical protein